MQEKAHLPGHHFWIIILKKGENVFGRSSELFLGHVFKISNLNNGVNSTGFEFQELNPTLKNLDPPPQESLQFLVISEDSVVHLPILEHAVRVVADGVAAAIDAVHVRHHALQFLEPQFLLHNGVGGEVAPPREAAEEHVGGVLDAEVAGAEELEEDDVPAAVGGGEEGDPPHGEGVGGGGGGGGGEEDVFEVVEGSLLGGFEVGDEVGIFFERRRADRRRRRHWGGDEGCLGGFWGGL